MCLIAFAWQAHPDFPLVVAANRDEWRERPAAPAHWWPDSPGMLAGKDLKADGTWLGVTQAGHFAALTNFRDPSDRKSGAPTRGKLVSDYLQGSSGPAEYLDTLRAPRHSRVSICSRVMPTRCTVSAAAAEQSKP